MRRPSLYKGLLVNSSIPYKMGNNHLGFHRCDITHPSETFKPVSCDEYGLLQTENGESI